jgi:hypothetical protein
MSERLFPPAIAGSCQDDSPIPVYVTRSEAIAIGNVVLGYLRYLRNLPQPREEEQFIARQLASFHDRLTRQLTGQGFPPSAAPPKRGW